jgi:hypothetical protein
MDQERPAFVIHQSRELNSSFEKQLDMIQPLGALKGNSVWDLASFSTTEVAQLLE